VSTFKPSGWHTVTPRIVTDDVPGLVAFAKCVFAATGKVQAGVPTMVTIGDSLIMISDGGDARVAMPAFLHVYVPDVDQTYARAMTARAESVESPARMPYGDRRATIKDLWGNVWQIATHFESGP
jgi:PhnB protein